MVKPKSAEKKLKRKYNFIVMFRYEGIKPIDKIFFKPLWKYIGENFEEQIYVSHVYEPNYNVMVIFNCTIQRFKDIHQQLNKDLNISNIITYIGLERKVMNYVI